MVRDRRAERIEEIGGVEVGEPRRREHVAHPPQVPQEAVVVAGIAGHRVAADAATSGHVQPTASAREQRQRAGMRRTGARVHRDVALSARPDDELAAHLAAAVLDLQVAVVGERARRDRRGTRR